MKRYLLGLMVLLMGAVSCQELYEEPNSVDYNLQDNQIWYTSSDNSYITFPEGAFNTSIVSHEFFGDKFIVTFNSTLTTIHSNAFEYAYNLSSITLPGTVRTVEPKAFANCNNLSQFKGDLATNDGLGLVINGKMCAFVNIYNAGYNSSYSIPNGVRELGDYLFAGNERLTSITFPSSLKKIGESAFQECRNLSEINGGSNLTDIGNRAFYLCDSLSSIELPHCLSYIGEEAFYYCMSLSRIAIPSNITEILARAFRECHSLTELSLPDSLESIGSEAFAACYNLEEVTIPESVTYIGSEAFDSCSELKSVFCKPTTPPTLGGYTFNGNHSERMFYVPAGSSQAYAKSSYWSEYMSSVIDYNYATGEVSPDLSQYDDSQMIRYKANSEITLTSSGTFGANFERSFWLDSKKEGVFIFDDSVTKIPNYAFYGCTALKSITLPDTVNSIGLDAFNGCSLLTAIYCKSLTPPTGSVGMFSGIPLNVAIYVPYTAYEEYKTATYWSDYAGYLVAYDFEHDEIYVHVEPAVVTFEDLDYYAAKDVAKYEEWSFLDSSEYSNKVIYPFEFDIQPESHGAYYYDIYECASDLLTDEEYKAALIASIETNGSKTQKYDYVVMSYGTDYTIVAIAANSNGEYGELAKLAVRCSSTGVNKEAITFVEWWEDMTGVSPALNVASELVVEASEGKYTLPYQIVNANASLKVKATTDADWIEELTVVEAEDKVTFYVSANESDASRSATITLSYGRATYDVIVTQQGKVVRYEIRYTTTDNTKVSLGTTYNWGANIVSNEYDSTSGGVITFDAAVTTIPAYAFQHSDIETIVLPDTVQSIDVAAFSSCSSLKDIDIPSSVTYIATDAFRYCTSLTEIIIPEGVESVGDYVFAGCTALKSVTLGGTLEAIGTYMFYDNSVLESVVISNGVNSIYEGAFWNCSSLKHITIPESVSFIGNSAFCNAYIEEVYFCGSVPPSFGSNIFNQYTYDIIIYVPEGSLVSYQSALSYYASRIVGYDFETNTPILYTIRYVTTDAESIYISDSFSDNCYLISNEYNASEGYGVLSFNAPITTIPDGAFSNYTRLAEIEIPEGVQVIGSSAFARCSTLTSINIPSSVTTLGNSAFGECTSLSSVTLPNNITTMDSYVFDGCTSLKSVVVGSGITSIPNGTFYECTALESVDILAPITSISGYSFYGCTALDTVYCRATTPPSGSETMFYNASSDFRVYVPFDSLAEYKKASYWKSYANNIIGYNYETGEIPGCEISYTTNDKRALELYTTEGFGASFVENRFDSSTGEGTLVFGGQVSAIPAQAFVACNNLSLITLPETIISIGEKAFYGCTGMSEITIPKSVSSIGKEAFKGCGGRAIINCPIANKSSENGYFYSAKFTEVSFGVGVDKIGNYAFQDCVNLQSVNFDNMVTTIGNYAFYGCTNLQSVDFGSKMTSIGYYAFYNCTSLNEVTIPSSVTTLEDGVFYGCEKLAMVNIAESVETIKSSVFYGCAALKSIVVPDSVKTIGSSVFRECTSLTQITLGSAITSIGSYAFDECTALTDVYISDLAAWCAIQFSNSDSSPFYYAPNLYVNGSRVTELVIPDNATEIKDYAFYGLDSITKLTIGKRVTSIGSHAFYDCTQLTKIYSKPITPPTLENNYVFDNYSNKESSPITAIYVPEESRVDYEKASYWSNYSSRIVGYDFNTSSDTTITPGGGIADAEEDDEVIM